MEELDYMKIPFLSIPQEIIDKYEIVVIEYRGWIYMEIQMGMPVLNQSGKISNDRLKNHLESFGYEPVRHTPVLWKHTSSDIVFTLVVDDLGVKYTNRQDMEHLRNAVQILYPVTTYWTRSKKFGPTLQWDYINRTVNLSMPN